VIDTVGIKVGPISTVDWFGTPHTSALHVIERYRLIDSEAANQAQLKQWRAYFTGPLPPFNYYGLGPIGSGPGKKGLQVEITVEDPGVFTSPWTALATYLSVDGEWPETVCAENVRELAISGKPPEAGRPDF
jgi:hypothetical protein